MIIMWLRWRRLLCLWTWQAITLCTQAQLSIREMLWPLVIATETTELNLNLDHNLVCRHWSTIDMVPKKQQEGKLWQLWRYVKKQAKSSQTNQQTNQETLVKIELVSGFSTSELVSAAPEVEDRVASLLDGVVLLLWGLCPARTGSNTYLLSWAVRMVHRCCEPRVQVVRWVGKRAVAWSSSASWWSQHNSWGSRHHWRGLGKRIGHIANWLNSNCPPHWRTKSEVHATLADESVWWHWPGTLWRPTWGCIHHVPLAFRWMGHFRSPPPVCWWWCQCVGHRPRDDHWSSRRRCHCSLPPAIGRREEWCDPVPSWWASWWPCLYHKKSVNQNYRKLPSEKDTWHWIRSILMMAIWIDVIPVCGSGSECVNRRSIGTQWRFHGFGVSVSVDHWIWNHSTKRKVCGTREEKTVNIR